MSSAPPLVSVILPVANSERYVATAINSVLAQSLSDLELIIIDDGSQDSSRSIIEKRSAQDARIVLLETGVCSGGPAIPRNLGIQRARGHWLAFIDADDHWQPNKLALQLSVAQQKNWRFVSSDCRRFDHDQQLAELVSCNDCATAVTVLDHQTMLRKNRVVTSSMVVEATVLAPIGFSVETKHIGVEDYLAWLQMMQKPSLAGGIVHQPLVNYRVRPDSLSASKLAMAKKIFGILSDYTINGQTLGWRRYGYFLSYIYFALGDRIIRAFNRND